MNKVLLIGNLAKEPEMHYTTKGLAVCGATIAVNNRRTKQVYYFDLTAFGKLAETLATHKHKGDEISVTGRLEQSRWESETGKTRSRVQIVIEECDFLRRKDNRRDEVQPDNEAPPEEPVDPEPPAKPVPPKGKVKR